MDRKYVDFRLAPDDLTAIRFGISPGHELCHAVRALQHPDRHPLLWGWLRAVRGRIPNDHFDVLSLIIRDEGYFPDFLTTTPAWDTSPADEAERLATIPAARFDLDMHKVLARSTGSRAAAVQRMIDHPDQARAMIARAWAAVWDAAVAPVWPQLERLLRADIAVRSRRIAIAGIGATVGDLHPRVQWHDGAVRVELSLHSEVLDCRGTGLVLVPSVMARRGCMVLTEPPAQPTLFYPAQGVTESWARDAASAERALSALLGPARAQILLTADEARTTSAVARDSGLAASTASHHLTVLREAGLITSTRAANRVLHVRSPLGEALLGGHSGG